MGRGEEEEAAMAATAIHKSTPAQPDTPTRGGQENPRSLVNKAGSVHMNSESDIPNKVEHTGNVTEKCLSNMGASYRNCFLF